MKLSMRLDTLDDLDLLNAVAGAAPAMAAETVAAGVQRMRTTMGVDTGQLQARTGITEVTESAGRVTVRFVSDTPYAGWHDRRHTQYWQAGVQEIARQAAGLNTTLATSASSVSGGTLNPRRIRWTPIDPATVTI